MVEKLFFLHNPKAGGTSVVDALARLFPVEQRCPRIENDATEHAARAGDYAAFKGYAFYGGHYGRDIYDAVGEGMPAATNFRWPVDRIVSLYRYFRHVVEITDEQARDPRWRSSTGWSGSMSANTLTSPWPGLTRHSRAASPGSGD